MASFFQRLWKFKANRVVAFVYVLLFLSIIIADSLQVDALVGGLGSLGIGGGVIFIGVNMMRLLPEDPRLRDRWRGQAVLLIAGGVIIIYQGFLCDCIGICFNW